LLGDVDLQSRQGGDPGVVAVEPGDVLFGKLRPYLAKSLFVDRPMYASAELLAMRSRSSAHPRYLRYVVLSRPFVEWAVATSDGAKMPRTRWEAVCEFSVDLPAVEEQLEIADFLDVETARIDALVEKKRRMITLLGDRRTSVMSDGLQGRFSVVPRCSAQLAWLEDRPQHWGETKLTYVARLGSRPHAESRSSGMVGELHHPVGNHG
jgi:type I restriction enzyme S subunit